MTKGKILMLGGSSGQMPAIEQAKADGYHVITCDYLPDNPGHQIADEYYNVSTTDIDKIVELAKTLKIDGVVAYSSDPAALTAAHVCEAMNLPGASVESVMTLSRKDLFRKFQAENGFHSVKYAVIHDVKEADKFLDWSYPIVVKPVDSSGSKGVTVVESWDEIESAIKAALVYSRCGKVIVEDYVDMPYRLVQGDGFVIQGDLALVELGDTNYIGIVPVCAVFPSTLPKELLQAAEKEVSRLIKAVGFSGGAINIEAWIGPDGDVFIMEIGARSGGSYIPQLMQYATGFDEVKAVVDFAMGKPVDLQRNSFETTCLLYALSSQESGYFEGIEKDSDINELVELWQVNAEPGDYIDTFEDASKAIGVVLSRCNEQYDYRTLMKHFSQCVKIRKDD